MGCEKGLRTVKGSFAKKTHVSDADAMSIQLMLPNA